MSALAPVAVVTPVLAATLLAATSRMRRPGFSSVVSLGATVASGTLCVLLLLQVQGGREVVWLGGWRPHGGVAVGVDFAVDELAAGLATLVCVLAVAAQIVAARVIRVEDHLFDAIVLVLVAGALGLCFSGDLFNLVVWLELVSVCGYVLVGYEVGQRKPIAGALGFAVTGTVGGILALFAVALVYGASGALNLAGIQQATAAHAPETALVAGAALVTVGFLVKAAVVPFHFWTADAYAVAPTPAALLLSGVYAELGVYAIARLQWTAFHGVVRAGGGAVGDLLIGLGVATALLGAAMCTQQRDLKRLLAFATIAQVGLFVAVVGLMDRDAVAGLGVWIAGDALAKAALFTVAGVLQHRHGTTDERALHGRLRGDRTLAAAVGLAALSMASLPASGAFLGKAIVEHASVESGRGWLVAVFVVVPAIVAGTVLRTWFRLVVGRPEAVLADGGAGADDAHADGAPGAEGDDGHEPAGDAAADDHAATDDGQQDTESESGGARAGRANALRIPAVVLAVGAVLCGLVPGARGGLGRAAATFTDPDGYARAVLSGASRTVAPHAPPAPDALAWALAVATVLAAALGGAVAARRPAPEEPSRGVLAALRAVHSGHVGDYLAWMAAGAAVVVVVLVVGVDTR